MPHVSRHTPVRKISDKIFNRLAENITAKGSAKERRSFLADLLSPTERIMLSKRYAVIYMLAKGYSFDSIQKTLQVSPSTIGRLWGAIQKGKFSSIVSRIKNPKQKDTDLIQWLADLVPPMSESKKQYIERMRRLHIR